MELKKIKFKTEKANKADIISFENSSHWKKWIEAFSFLKSFWNNEKN